MKRRTPTQDWMWCDGNGGVRQGTPVAQDAPARVEAALTVSRRQVLVGATMSLLAWSSTKSALSQVSVSKQTNGNVLVVIFLRGGADGLNIVTPYGEDAYYRNRPTLGIRGPGTGAERLLDLDGFFGLNPALRPLEPFYKEGELAIIHAVGSQDQTRSHFEAMNAMERGLPNDQAATTNGWLARQLSTTPPRSDSPLRAVSFSDVMPESLRGATGAMALSSLSEFQLALPAESKLTAADVMSDLRDLYGSGQDAVHQAGQETLHVLESLNRLDPAKYQPAHGAAYPVSPLGQGLKETAFLIRAGLGLEVAALDKGGWDTHVTQGTTGGWLAGLLDDVGQSVAAFARDLGPEMGRVNVVVQTEFGRRLAENSGLGTDHGRGSVMFVLGGGVKGGKVYAKWPGLRDDQLEPPGDLRVTTDYRNVLAELLEVRGLNPDASQVFEGLERKNVGLMSA